MKSFLTTIVALCVVVVAIAQEIPKQIFAYSRTDRLLIGTCDMNADYQVLDTAQIVVDYKVSYRNSPNSQLDVRYKLLCGEHTTLFYSVAQRYENMARHKDNWSEEEMNEFYAAGVPTIVIPSEIYLISNEFRIRHNVPFSDDIVYEYRESLEKIEWQLTNHTQEICGYLCSSAETSYGGRVWRVWFSPEIPLSSGPWLLRGLPGLILMAEDSEGDFRFEMEGISQQCEEIRLYDWNTEQITKKQWLKFERNAHLNPYSQFGQGGQVRFYNSSDMQELKSEWTIEYYPLYRY